MHSYFGVGSLGLGGLMSLWWFAHCCRIRKAALPGLLPTVRLAATTISEVNAYVIRGLSSIIWFIIPHSSVISSAVHHLQILCIGRDPLLELRGLHRCPVGKKPRPCLPITCRRFSSFGHVHHISVSIHCYGQNFA